MGQNADARSIDWYLDLATKVNGTKFGAVLELGCGTGRITLPLAAAGHHVIGIDRSWRMLQQLTSKAERRGLLPLITTVLADFCQSDINRCFGLVICSFSALAYVTRDEDRIAILRKVRNWLSPGGIFAFDLFNALQSSSAVPDGVMIFDYRRPLPDGEWGSNCTLERSKMLLRDTIDDVTRIHRFYRICNARGSVIRSIETESVQCERSPASMTRELNEAGFQILEVSDFGGSANAKTSSTLSFVVAPC